MYLVWDTIKLLVRELKTVYATVAVTCQQACHYHSTSPLSQEGERSSKLYRQNKELVLVKNSGTTRPTGKVILDKRSLRDGANNTRGRPCLKGILA
eukprot:2432338-Pyramimonas_sp.AAC.1